MLLHMDGSDGSTVFADSSSASNTITLNGDVKLSTAQSKFGSSSAAFNGSTDYLTIPTNSSFAFGADDFTIECWFYQSSTPNGSALIAEKYNSGQNFYFAISFGSASSSFGAIPCFFAQLGGNMIHISHDTSLSNNQWHHIAVCRHTGNVKLYVNGISSSSGKLYTNNIPLDDEIYIGKRWDNSGSPFFNGYIDEVRITKGVARYTENFTPPTAPFPNP